MRGCYPGSFDPLTVAHVAIAAAAVTQCGLASLDFVVSEVALAKEQGHASSLAARVAAVEDATGCRCAVTDRQLLADIADGYDVLVIGADKWWQLHDAAFYGGSVEARDAALRRLPPIVAVAPRAGVDVPIDQRVRVLELPVWIAEVSSSAVRAGAEYWRAAGRAGDEAQTRQGPE